MCRKSKFVTGVLVTSITLAPVVGCESLPGGPKEQGTVIGGASGAAAGALIAKHNRLLGALIGGALGAGGGYLIGANWDKISGKDKERAKQEAQQADQRARENPVTADQVKSAKTADANGDGFVTLDEVVAMQDAGISKQEQIRRLQRTQQYFELTDEQVQYLKDHGVSQDVITAMEDMNRDTRTASEKTSPDSSSVGNQAIGHEKSTTSY